MEDDLRCKTTFVGRRRLLDYDPCMLPSPLCGIFKVKGVLDETKAVLSPAGAWLRAELGNKSCLS